MDAGEQAIIGDGGKFTNGGPTGGLITINTGSLALEAPTATDDNAAGQARITNRGTGEVDGDMDVTTTGDIVLLAGDGGLSGIGNGQAGTGPTNGDIQVTSYRNITLAATGGGEARIATGLEPDSSITVAAVGNITLFTGPDADGTTAGALAFIGGFQNDAGP